MGSQRGTGAQGRRSKEERRRRESGKIERGEEVAGVHGGGV